MKIIETTEALAAACSLLAQSDYVTVDTEFMRESTYWPKLCLIQMAGPEGAYIVDPLSDKGLDLSPFFDLMADESTVKVFHAGRQDIEIVYNLGGLIPHPVFDSQVAAMVCGFGDSISYDQLVWKIADQRIDKSSRFTDWSRRPLSDKQLSYALADVTHLREVYIALKANLEEQDRSHWVSEEMEILTSESTYRTDPSEAWKRMKMRVRKPIELAILQALAHWREEEAQRRDMPRGRILKDDAIYELAMQAPRSPEALSRLRTMPKGFERSRSAEDILAAVDAACSLEKSDLPRLPKGRVMPEGSQAVVEMLKVLLKIIVAKHGVAAKVIANVDDLEQIAADDKADVAALKGWRRDLFGRDALRLKHGELALAIVNRKTALIDLNEDADLADGAVKASALG